MLCSESDAGLPETGDGCPPRSGECVGGGLLPAIPTASPTERPAALVPALAPTARVVGVVATGRTGVVTNVVGLDDKTKLDGGWEAPGTASALLEGWARRAVRGDWRCASSE